MEDSIYRLRYRDVLTLCVMGLLFLGIVMVQSASMHVTGHAGWQWTKGGTKHFGYAAVALATYLCVGRFEFSSLGQYGRHG